MILKCKAEKPFMYNKVYRSLKGKLLWYLSDITSLMDANNCVITYQHCSKPKKNDEIKL